MVHIFKGTADLADALTVTSGFSSLGVVSVGTTAGTFLLRLGTTNAIRIVGDNSFVGLGAGLTTIGNANTFTGHNAGRTTTGGVANTFVGASSGYSNTTGGFNTFGGFEAGYKNITGAYNTFFGGLAGLNNTTGGNNTFTGLQAGFNNTTGGNNTFTGLQAGLSNTTGYDNAFTGVSAGHSNTTGYDNAFMGVRAGYSNTTGLANTYTGSYAGYYSTTGNNNTIIGYGNNDPGSLDGSSNTLLGAKLAGYGSVSNTIIISDGANTKNITCDAAAFRTTAPQRPPQYTASTLPSPVTSGLGAMVFCTNARRAGEAAGAGTGCPLWSTGTEWFTTSDNTLVTS